MDNYLKIIFAGTPEFSVPTLIALNTDYSKVIHVLTQPDKKSGRGMKKFIQPGKKNSTKAKYSYTSTYFTQR